jgi:hypothetical protein
VTRQAENMIRRGLEFLKKHQRPDGSYDMAALANVMGRQGKREQQQNQLRQRVPQQRWQYPVAMSAMAGLAFLASGSTPTRGPYAQQVSRIRDYLLGHPTRQRDGLLTNGREPRPMYSHAFTMTFLAHVFGQERDAKRREQIRKVLHRAVDLCARSQTDDGGWGYAPNPQYDEGTVTVTQLQALRACRDVGIYVPKRVIDNAVSYIEESANPDGSVRYQIHAWDHTRHGVTCASVVALWQAGQYDTELIRRIYGYVELHVVERWRRFQHTWTRYHHAEYILYYLGQAKYLMGGKSWDRFYKRLLGQMADAQSQRGSWEGKDLGEIYGTCVALLVLQLPYNRLSTFER